MNFEYLRKFRKFKKLFVEVSDLKTRLDYDESRDLLNELNNPYYYLKFGTQEIVYLRDMLLTERAVFRNRCGKKQKR